MNRYKTVMFGYNFKHWKTQTSLINMFLYGIVPDALILADWEELNMLKSVLPIIPKYRFHHTPKQLQEAFQIPLVIVCGHNSIECEKFLCEHNFELGIIAGARILEEKIIRKVKHGIINIHPGKLPDCRGSDTLKWSIENNIDMEVTAHFIDKNVDRGLKIQSRKVPIYSDDTLTGLGLRSQHAEQILLIDVLKDFNLNGIDTNKLEPIGRGTHNYAMPEYIESGINKKLIEYCRERSGI